MKRIIDLTKGVPCTVQGNSAVEIKGLAYHSAVVKPGYLFVAIEGFKVSGQAYIDEAVNRGAVAVATTDVKRAQTGSPWFRPRARGAFWLRSRTGSMTSRPANWTWSVSPAPTVRRRQPSWSERWRGMPDRTGIRRDDRVLRR